MDNWRFTQDVFGAWGWQHTVGDGTVSVCSQHFTSRTDCIADAMRHGYLALGEQTGLEPASGPDLSAPLDRSSESGESPSGS